MHEFHFVDDCALATQSHEDIQYKADSFAAVCWCFGLTVSLAKIKAISQTLPSWTTNTPTLPPSTTKWRRQLQRHQICNEVRLHYTTLRYATLRYATLRYATLRYATLHYTTLHYIEQQWIPGCQDWG